MDILFSSGAVLELELWTRSLTVILHNGWLPIWRRDTGASTLQAQLIGEALSRLDGLCAEQRQPGSVQWALWREDEPETITQDAALQGLEAFIEATQLGLKTGTTQPGALRTHPGLDLFYHSVYFRELVYRHFESRAEGIICGGILGRVPDAALRMQILDVFIQMLRLSAYLRFIQRGLAGSRKPQTFLMAFVLVHRDLTGLCRRISAVGRSKVKRETSHDEALSLAHKAILLESRRVFRRELLNVAGIESTREMRVRLEDSAGLLQNCLQNCFLVLARGLNPRFAGHPAVDDGFALLEQSVRLLNDLKQLAERVSAASGDDSDFYDVLADLQRFSHRSMRHLRYRDQVELHDFIEGLAHSLNRSSRHDSLHRLSIFLNALCAEVGKRGALKGVAAVKSRETEMPRLRLSSAS